jgi:tripartite-type tricarboxylate transporter receptor subunit TctC
MRIQHIPSAVRAGGNPLPIIDRLTKETAWILAEPEMQAKFVKLGLPIVAETSEAFRARIAREVPMCRDVIDKAGLRTKSE